MNDDQLHNEIFGDDQEEPLGGKSDLPTGFVAMLKKLHGEGLFGTPVVGEGVTYHDQPEIVLPKGMSFEAAIKLLQQLKDDAETETSWHPKFNYRPDDGAHTVAQVLKRIFGMVLGSSKTLSFFGDEHTMPAETRSIQISLSESLQVPWGLVTLPMLPGLEITLCDRHPHPEYGQVFDLHITGPRKYQGQVEAIIDAVGKELATNSIYRGKALLGGKQLEFFDTSWFDPKKIVFAAEIECGLRAKLWTVLEQPELLRSKGISLKRAVLLYGPYGTGKTSIGMITAQIAIKHGWTFLSAKSGDSITDMLTTARLYQRAVVFFEDIDTEGDAGNDLPALLEAFDGINAKNAELVVVMTTNRYEDIPKGILRPGRLDSVFRIAELDRQGTERLIRAVVAPSDLSNGIDFDEVYAAAEGYLPAYVKEVATSALLFAIERQGAGDFTLTTEDLVAAAQSLRPQFEAHLKAQVAPKRTTMEDLVQQAVRAAIHNGKVVDAYDQYTIKLDGEAEPES